MLEIPGIILQRSPLCDQNKNMISEENITTEAEQCQISIEN